LICVFRNCSTSNAVVNIQISFEKTTIITFEGLRYLENIPVDTNVSVLPISRKKPLYIAFCCGVTRDFWQDDLLNSFSAAVQADILHITVAIIRPLHIQTLPFLPKTSSSASSKEKIISMYNQDVHSHFHNRALFLTILVADPLSDFRLIHDYFTIYAMIMT
jgi:hypothetical protein